MTTPDTVETITETLGRLMLYLRRPAGNRETRGDARSPAIFATAPGFGDRITMTGNGQMLLPGIAEPRLWSLGSTKP